MTMSQGPGAEAGRDVRHAAEDVRRETGTLAEEARHTTEAWRRDARRAADDAKRTAHDYAEQQKNAVAGRTASMAAALNAAADNLRGQGDDRLAGYTADAARYIERTADALRERQVEDLASTVVDFARRQPAAFIGGAVLAGFVLSRFLKSSAERPHGEAPGAGHEYPTQATAPMQTTTTGAAADVTPAGGTL